ncbi:MAG: hypothetical protein AAB092_03615 [Chloroflexota bacterium]
MKTTVELPDDLFREAKATAARRGTALKEYLREAVAEKLAREGRLAVVSRERNEWPVPPMRLDPDESRRIDALIEEAFEQIEPEDEI